METPFITHMQGKYPELDIKAIINLIDSNVAEIQPIKEDGNNEVKVPIGSDLNKNLIIKVISEYLESL